MRLRSISLAAALLLLSLLAAAPGTSRTGPSVPEGLLDGYLTGSGPWGTVYYRDQREVRERLEVEIGEALGRVEARLGRKRQRPFTAVLAPDPREFRRIHSALAGSWPEAHVAGVAFPGRDLLLVRGEAFAVLLPPAERPRAVLEHELAHLVIHRRGGTVVPRWLDEGLAQWAARQLPGPDDEAFLSGLARVGALPSLESLERQIPTAHDLAAIAYQGSALLVLWLRMRFGPGAPGDLLDALEAGAPAASALKARTGLALPAFEREFRAWLGGRRPFVEVLLRTLNFWTVASLLALVAIARAALRRRRKLREMEEAERLEAEGPPPSGPAPLPR